MRGQFDSFYPAHASQPMRIHGASDQPRRVHEAEPEEVITGLDIWDNTELTAIEAWRQWFKPQAAFWASVACIECELGRACSSTPLCAGVCVTCGYAECECPS